MKTIVMIAICAAVANSSFPFYGFQRTFARGVNELRRIAQPGGGHHIHRHY
jgi:hypothetical protein